MHFFTPIEVVRQQQNSYSFEQLRCFGQDFLLQITKPTILSLADQRKQLINWLKSMSPLQRQLAATFYNVEFVCLVRKIYQEWHVRDESIQYSFSFNDEHYSINRHRVYRSNRDKQARLLQQVVLVSRGQLYEGVTVSDWLLTDLQAFFELMDELQGGVMLGFSEIRQQQLKTGKIHLQLQMEEQESKSLGEWISKLLVKQIYLSFQTRYQKSNTFNLLKMQERQYGKLWKDIDCEQRKEIINRSLKKSREEVLKDYMRSVGVLFSDLPSVYIQSDQQIKIQEIVDCNPKDLIYKLVFTALSDSLSLLNMYKVQIVLEIEAELASLKQKPKKKSNRRKKKVAQDRQKISLIKQQIKQEIQKIEQQQDEVDKPCQSQGQDSLRLNQIPTQTKEMCTEKDQQSHQNQGSLQTLPKQVQESMTFDSDNQPKQSKLKQTVPNINQSLQKYYRNIKSKCLQRDRCRKIVLNRLIVLFSQLNLTCKAYGSYAYQLTVPDSDLDVLIDSPPNFLVGYFSPREQIINSLLFIQKILQNNVWVSDFVFLPAAKIPLLKFKADASYYFEYSKLLKLKVNGKKQKLGDSLVQVDLTIQPLVDSQQICHFGVQSTKCIKQWVERYPQIKQLIIVVKSMIRQKGLHVSYEGGISSYATILLLVAFVKFSTNSSLNTSISQLAVFLRRFYVQNWLIDITQDDVLIRQRQESGAVLRNPFDGRNLLQRSFRFRQIVQVIENWKGFCQQ